METPGSLFFPVQEDTLEKLLSDMDLSPGGPSNLTMASENPPQFLQSPDSDIPALCPNSGLSENPLKQLLANEEGVCQLWGRRGQDPGREPPHTLSCSLPLHVMAAVAQIGSSR